MVVGFAAAVACGATVLFALAPALRIVRADPARSMKEGSRGTDGPGRATPDVPSSRRRWRCPSRCSSPPRLATSLARLQAIDVGFATDVLLHRLRFRPYACDSLDRVEAFYTALAERLAELPGVEAAALATSPPLAGANDTAVHREDGRRRQRLIDGSLRSDGCKENTSTPSAFPFSKGVRSTTAPTFPALRP